MPIKSLAALADSSPPLVEVRDAAEHHAAVVTALRTQTLLLERQLELAHAELERGRRERDALSAALAESEAATRGLSASVVDLTAENSELIELYVAAHRLLDARDVVEQETAVREIVITMIGCEEFAVYDIRGEELHPVASMGLDRTRLGVARVDGAGSVARAARERAVVYADEPLACAPLRHRGAVTGVLALHALLPHKPALTALDYRLLDLLAAHGGRAAGSAAA